MTVRESLPNTGETADTRRIYQASLLTPVAAKNSARGGVFPEGGTLPGLRVHQTPTASANVLVEAGTAQIPMSVASGLNGVSTFINDAQLVQRYLQDFPADSQPRVDRIVARAQDGAGGDASTVNSIAIIKGTAGSSTVPAIPAGWNAVPLYTCALPANATTILDGYLTREAVTTVATGGILPVSGGPAFPQVGDSYLGQYLDDPATGLWRFDGTKWARAIGSVLACEQLDSTVECGNPEGILISFTVPMIAGRYYTCEFYAHGTQITSAASIVRANLNFDGAAAVFGDMYAFYQAAGVSQPVIGTAGRTVQATTTGTGNFQAVALSNSSKVRFLPNSVGLTVKDAGA